jgi:hypothetical protein
MRKKCACDAEWKIDLCTIVNKDMSPPQKIITNEKITFKDVNEFCFTFERVIHKLYMSPYASQSGS